MNEGDIVYPFFEKGNHAVGLVLGRTCSVTGQDHARILIHGKIYSVPVHQIREIKQKV